MNYPTIADIIGHTPLVKLQRLYNQTTNILLVKLEGHNPAGSVKDRAALGMIEAAEKQGLIKSGDTLIEATSGNTGIALAMVAAVKGYKMILIMPENLSEERRAAMKAYGAELILVSKEEGMEGARDLANCLKMRGEGIVLDQFANANNTLSHIQTTGPEIWQQTQGQITHFVSSMGTTGTVMGVSTYLKQQNSAIQVIGVQPKSDDEHIPGIRRWPKQYLPKIYHSKQVDAIQYVSQVEAEKTMHDLATLEGIFCGVSAGGAVSAALKLSKQISHATIVTIIPDRGDRYISTGVFPI